jgi:hypothetical protein
MSLLTSSVPIWPVRPGPSLRCKSTSTLADSRACHSFAGKGLTTKEYMAATGASARTAPGNRRNLVQKEVLSNCGNRHPARYYLP